LTSKNEEPLIQIDTEKINKLSTELVDTKEIATRAESNCQSLEKLVQATFDKVNERLDKWNSISESAS